MTTLDLMPLTDETIAEMGFNKHDLWLIKIHNDLFGPFETESLKQFASENEEQFKEAYASRVDENDFKPFWTYPLFQRRKVQALSSTTNEGPFWILVEGLKVGPLSFHDIDKRIEMDLLVMTDHVSIDNGETWNKIFEIEGLDRRAHEPEELPLAPTETSFHKARLSLVEKQNQNLPNPTYALADMAHSAQEQAKVIPFRADEITFHAKKQTEVSSTVRSLIPTAAAVALIVITGSFFIQSEENTPAEVTIVESSGPRRAKIQKVVPQGQMPGGPTERSPASVSYGHSAPSPSVNRQEHFSTIIETHEPNYHDEPVYERDPLDGPVMEGDLPKQQEHSLVGNPQQEEPEISLDAAMNGVEQPAEPVVEELSDF